MKSFKLIRLKDEYFHDPSDTFAFTEFNSKFGDVIIIINDMTEPVYFNYIGYEINILGWYHEIKDVNLSSLRGFLLGYRFPLPRIFQLRLSNPSKIKYTIFRLSVSKGPLK